MKWWHALTPVEKVLAPVLVVCGGFCLVYTGYSIVIANGWLK